MSCGRTRRRTDSPAGARRRDLVAWRLGYRVLRLSYEQIHHDWENTRLVLLRLLRSGLHLAEPVPL